MSDGRNNEDDGVDRMTRIALSDKRLGYVSDEEIVDRHVPGSPKLSEVAAVPPVAIKFSVSES